MFFPFFFVYGLPRFILGTCNKCHYKMPRCLKTPLKNHTSMPSMKWLWWQMASKVKSTTKFGIPWTGRKTGMLEFLCRDHPKNLNICVIICIICALLWICNDMCIFSIFVPTCEGNSLTYGARWRTWCEDPSSHLQNARPVKIMENTTEHGIYPFLFTKCNLWVSQH